MITPIQIRSVVLGEGRPKICVPLMGTNQESLLEEINALAGLHYDIVEWRMDYHEDIYNLSSMQQTAAALRDALGETPILATFRTKQEGGQQALDIPMYITLLQAIVDTQHIDLIDIELFTGDEIVSKLITYCKEKNVHVILSNHDFNQTPSKEEIIARLCEMQTLGADICKIAVMPQNPEDVLTLLSATYTMYHHYATRPLITISMGCLGLISRLAGGTFGSVLTFAAASEASAPGQMPTNDLAFILDRLHHSLLNDTIKQ